MTWYVLGTCPDNIGRDQIGGKAHSIDSMMKLGLPVPPAFVLGTDECAEYDAGGGALTDAMRAALHEGVAALESSLDRSFGGARRPLLVSVRSGAARSMPGMMDTVLNLGINPSVAAVLAEETGDAAYAADTVRRFEEQFAKVVGDVPPDDPWDQLERAVAAVFESWQSPRAIAYRKHHGISDEGGTAVTVQAMVFGNIDETSGTGVLFTRNPVEARREPLGEWLLRGQGEDVVSGRSTPRPLADLATEMPELHGELMRSADLLERTSADIQDIEFTIESGRLWLLQTRAAKRSARAAVHHAVQFEAEGLISVDTALSRITPAQLRTVLAPHISEAAASTATVLARGEVGCPGLAHGVVAGCADDAEDLALDGTDVVLARPTTDPDDVHGMVAARAVITEIGGTTSHAAVVSRELDRPCVVGCGVGTLMDLVGRQVTVDATAGVVYGDYLEIEEPVVGDHPDLAVVAAWLADEARSGHPLAGVLQSRSASHA